jgi:hypothetical protein
MMDCVRAGPDRKQAALFRQCAQDGPLFFFVSKNLARCMIVKQRILIF